MKYEGGSLPASGGTHPFFPSMEGNEASAFVFFVVNPYFLFSFMSPFSVLDDLVDEKENGHDDRNRALQRYAVG